MNTAQKKFNKVMRSRKRRAKIVRLGRNNHAMGNEIMNLRKRGKIQMGKPQAPKDGVGSKIKKAFGLGGKKMFARQKTLA